MNRFYKVSQTEFYNGVRDNIIDYENCNYDDIIIPKRSTVYSAGYDFFSPVSFTLKPGETITIPTGVKVQLNNDKFLAIVPRSGLGFKFRCQLDNTMGVIDSDYFDNKNNEGHIFVRITNDSKNGKIMTVEKGKAFCQGIILKYYTVDDDNANGVREGGMGSTDKQE